MRICGELELEWSGRDMGGEGMQSGFVLPVTLMAGKDGMKMETDLYEE